MPQFRQPGHGWPHGVFDAIVKAVEVTDDCLREVVEAGRANGYQFIVIADHGNADFARHPDGSPHTAQPPTRFRWWSCQNMSIQFKTAFWRMSPQPYSS